MMIRPLERLAAAAPCCGVCGGAGFDIVQRQSLALAGIGRHELAFGICLGCGHVQQTPPVPEPVMLRHYETMSNYTAFNDVGALRAAPPIPLTRRLLSLARDVGAAPGRLYEVGCATGLHLHHFRAAGWSVGGCDPSGKAAAQAHDIYGIDVDTGDEASCLPRQSGVDLVLISHVLEHLHAPADFMARAAAALRPGGDLVVEVPCAIEPSLLPPGWFSFEHLHYFSPETLSALMQDAGFEVIEMRVALRAFIYPVIAVIGRKTDRRIPVTHRRPGGAGGDVARAFVEREAALWARARARLAHLSGPAFIWGAGVHTAQLLDRTGLDRQILLRGIVDRDPQKWGMTQAGAPVIAPEAFFAATPDLPVIVSSYYAEREIVAALRAAGVHPDRIVTLYTDGPT